MSCAMLIVCDLVRDRQQCSVVSISDYEQITLLDIVLPNILIYCYHIIN